MARFDYLITECGEEGRLYVLPLSDRAIYWLETLTLRTPAMCELVNLDISQAARLHGLGLRFH